MYSESKMVERAGSKIVDQMSGPMRIALARIVLYAPEPEKMD